MVEIVRTIPDEEAAALQRDLARHRLVFAIACFLMAVLVIVLALYCAGVISLWHHR